MQQRCVHDHSAVVLQHPDLSSMEHDTGDIVDMPTQGVHLPGTCVCMQKLCLLVTHDGHTKAKQAQWHT